MATNKKEVKRINRMMKKNKRFRESCEKLYDDCEELHWRHIQRSLPIINETFMQKQYGLVIRSIDDLINQGDFKTERIIGINKLLSNLKQTAENAYNENQ